ncbi:uncharacterized protein LOC133108596 [Conger conger]|uniref:uncharacterized protein LOC133108596 n=1 Tax=Conger conger TaxID=82655 RepID=UPI002A5AD781|nr:uncharacterized protein LOC133108596 [Conger conger]
MLLLRLRRKQCPSACATSARGEGTSIEPGLSRAIVKNGSHAQDVNMAESEEAKRSESDLDEQRQFGEMSGRRTLGGVGDSIRGLQFSSDDEEGGGRLRPAPRCSEGEAHSSLGEAEEELDGAPVIRADDEDEEEADWGMDTGEAVAEEMDRREDLRSEPPSEGSETSTHSDSGPGTGADVEMSPVEESQDTAVSTEPRLGGAVPCESRETGHQAGDTPETESGSREGGCLFPPVDIKDEPIDEEYDRALAPQPPPPPKRIKDEPEASEELVQHQKTLEELRISSVFSVGGNSTSPSAPAGPPQPSLSGGGRGASRGGRTDTPPAPPPGPAPPPRSSTPSGGVRASCSGCCKVLQKGQTAFQRKGSSQLFCSTVCLTGCTLPPAPLKPPAPRKTCHYCLKEIQNPKDVIIAPVDASGTVKDFCSQACLSSFGVKRTRKPPPETTAIRCSVCKKTATINHEVNFQGTVHKLCSDGCFSRFRSSNNLALNCCEACGSYCYSSAGHCLLLHIEGATRKFCSQACLTAYKQKAGRAIPCAGCQGLRSVVEMVEGAGPEGTIQLYCTAACSATANGTPTGITGASFPCTSCRLVAVPQFHLALNDGSIRNFCSYNCVLTFQAGLNKGLPQGPVNGGSSAPESVSAPPSGVPQPPPAPATLPPLSAPRHGQAPPHGLAPPLGPALVQAPPSPATHGHGPALPAGLPRDPAPDQAPPSLGVGSAPLSLVKLSCRQCRRLFSSKPELLLFKGQMQLFCGRQCTEAYRKVNFVTARCEYCKLDKMIRDVIKFNRVDRAFCSEGCKLLFKHDLAKRTGNPCRTCAYCTSTAQKMIQNHFGGKLEEFCREECMALYTVLFYQMAKCDWCQRQGKLQEAQKWLGEMKHFCNLSCLLLFSHQQSSTYQQQQHPTQSSTYEQQQHPTQSSTYEQQQHPTQTCTYDQQQQHPAQTCTYDQQQQHPAQTCTYEQHSLMSGAIALPAHIPTGAVPAGLAPLPPPAAAPAALPLLPIYASKEATPVIANVVSLASAPTGQPYVTANTALPGAVPTTLIQTKINGDASTQTDALRLPAAPRRVLKNKALLCKPISQNKGTLCRPHQQSTESQTDEVHGQKILLLPVPVPVFIPVPMHLYAQYTPLPVGLPVPLPVPMFVPSSLHRPESKSPPAAPKAEEEEEEEEEKDKPISYGDQGSTYSGDLESEGLSTPLSWEEEPAPSAQRLATPDCEDPPATSATPPLMDLEADFPLESLDPEASKGLGVTPRHRGRRRPGDSFPPRKRVRPASPEPRDVPLASKPETRDVPFASKPESRDPFTSKPGPPNVPHAGPPNFPHPEPRNLPFAANPESRNYSHSEPKNLPFSLNPESRNFPHPQPRSFPHHEPRNFPHHEPRNFPHHEPRNFPHHEPRNFPFAANPESRSFPHSQPRNFPHHEPRNFPHHEPRNLPFTSNPESRNFPHHESRNFPHPERRNLPFPPNRDPRNFPHFPNPDGFGRKEASAVAAGSPACTAVPPGGRPKLLHMYGVNAWKSWVLSERGKPGSGHDRLKEDVLQCSSVELSEGLCRFVTEARRPSGEPYTPDSIFYLCLGLQQYLLVNGRIENLFTDPLYSNFSLLITSILRAWRPTVLPNGSLLSRVEEDFLWECKQLGAYSPVVLLNTLLFFSAKMLLLHTLPQHRRLSFCCLQRCSRQDPHTRTHTSVLRYTPPKPSPRSEAERIVSPVKRKLKEEEDEEDDEEQDVLEMPENTENPLRCPVRLYEFYLSKWFGEALESDVEDEGKEDQGNVDLENSLEEFDLDLGLDDSNLCPSGVSDDDSSSSSSCMDQLVLEARNHSDLADLVPSVTGLTVKTISKRPNGKRKFDKRHYCFYCKKAYCKLARHLEMKHAKEADVALALDFPKGSRRRSMLLEQIRSRGDFHHNVEVLKQGAGELVTWKSPVGGKAPSDFLPCQYCLGFFSKKDLWKHQACCRCKPETEVKSGVKKRVQSISSELLPLPNENVGACKAVLHRMNIDDVSQQVKKDPLICKYGDMLISKHADGDTQYVASKMRDLGRFVLAVQKIDRSVMCLQDVISPCRFDLAVDGAQRLAGYDPTTRKHKTPSVFPKIGYSLRKAAEVAVGEFVIKRDVEAEGNAKEFIRLLQSDWSASASCRVPSSRPRLRRCEVVPLTEDVMEFQEFLQDAAERARAELQEKPSLAAWTKLSQLLLSEIAVFNGRQEGEIAVFNGRREGEITVFNGRREGEVAVFNGKREGEVAVFNGRREGEIAIFNGRQEGEVAIFNGRREGEIAIFNGRREGEVAKMLQDTNINRNKTPVNTEGYNSLTALEQQLAKKFSRIEIQGKCGRKDLVLLTDSMLALMEVLNNMRDKVGVPQSNPYFFATLRAGSRFQAGDFLRSCATDSKAQRPEDLTTPRLRTPVAMLCQMAALQDNVLDQLAESLGHGLRARGEDERLSENKLRLKKISELFLAMDEETVDLHSPAEDDAADTEPDGSELSPSASMTLEPRSEPGPSASTTFEPKSEPGPSTSMTPVPGSEPGTSASTTCEPGTSASTTCEPSPSGSMAFESGSEPDQIEADSSLPSPDPGAETGTESVGAVLLKPQKKKPWSDAEQTAVKSGLCRFIAQRKVPGKEDCEACLRAKPGILRNRSWKDVKYYVYNTIQSNRKRGITFLPDGTEQPVGGADGVVTKKRQIPSRSR